MFRLAVLLICLASLDAFLFRSSDNWNGLKVHWGFNPFSHSNFVSQPRTEVDAKAAGFSMISDCGATPHFAGKRYAKNGDTSVVLLYDVRGYIAGIQAGFSAVQPNGYPSVNLKRHPFVLYNNVNYITTYFVNPKIICTTGRTAAMFSQQGTGTDLYIQNGTMPSASALLHIPKHENGMAGTMWTKGKCFPSMGMHYWYNVRKDMKCDEFYPVFLLYNGGKLNGLGWAFSTDLSAPNYEHPPQDAIGSFINPVPDCFAKLGRQSTLHIYLTDSPHLDLC